MPEIHRVPSRPSLQDLILRGEVCHALRSKKLFYQDGGEASAAENAAPFWCARSQSLAGPDGKIAELETCRPGRTCCDAG
jgi:hypothetical protein